MQHNIHNGILTENISIIFLKSAMFIRTSSLSLSWSSFLKYKTYLLSHYMQLSKFISDIVHEKMYMLTQYNIDQSDRHVNSKKLFFLPCSI